MRSRWIHPLSRRRLRRLMTKGPRNHLLPGRGPITRKKTSPPCPRARRRPRRTPRRWRATFRLAARGSAAAPRAVHAPSTRRWPARRVLGPSRPRWRPAIVTRTRAVSAANARSGEIVPGAAVAAVPGAALAASTPRAQGSVRSGVNEGSAVAGAVVEAGDVVAAGVAALEKGTGSGRPRSLPVPRRLQWHLLLPHLMPHPPLRRRLRSLTRQASPSGRG